MAELGREALDRRGDQRQRHDERGVEVGRLREPYGKAGVGHVARCHALVHEPGFGADMLGDVGQEGDRLVMHLALDLADALDLEFAALAQCLRRATRDHAELFLHLAGIGLDVELNAEIVLRLPDRRHLRPAVARDHAETSSAEISLFGEQDAAAAESTMKDSAISTSSWYSP